MLLFHFNILAVCLSFILVASLWLVALMTFSPDGVLVWVSAALTTPVSLSWPCRQTTLAVYLMSLVGMVVYAATLDLGHLWVVFITAGALG